MPATSPPRITRRTALGAVGLAGVGLAALSGCDDPTTTPARPRATQSAEITPDVRLAIELLPGLQRAAAVTSSAVDRFPQLDKAFRPLLLAQKAHVKVLTEAVPAHARPTSSSAPVAIGTQPKVARRRVLRQAVARRDALNAAALRAESGQFAHVLASMGAGLSQRLTVIGGTA